MLFQDFAFSCQSDKNGKSKRLLQNTHRGRVGGGVHFLCLNTSEININNRHIFSHQLPTSCHLDERLTINMFWHYDFCEVGLYLKI